MNRVTIPCDMVDLGWRKGEIFFETEFPIRYSPELLITATLIAKMKKGSDYCYPNMVADCQYLTNIHKAQALLQNWHANYHGVSLDAIEAIDSQRENKAYVGCFFSGGVDSFYTLLEQQSDITHLICIQGFDISVDNDVLFSVVENNLKMIAKQMGIMLITIKTNLRDYFIANEMDWGSEAFGVGLATVGHLLSAQFSKIYIPASLDMDNLMPWGSHPDLDPLWSSNNLQFVHHGCVPRTDKIKRLVGNDLALQYLRVCYLNKNNAYNCCRCEKCVRTMISLQAYGVLDCCDAFPEKLSAWKVRTLWITSEAARIFVGENIRLLEQTGHEPKLKKALEDLLERPQWMVDLYLYTRKKKNRLISIVSYLWARLKVLMAG